MSRISQRELRNNTAQILRDLEASGESEVTSNNTPVAILSPLTLEPVERMFRTGQASPPRSNRLPEIKRVKLDEPSTDILNDLKGER